MIKSSLFQKKRYLMGYKEKFHPKFKSDLKKIEKSIIKDVKEKHLNIILQNPFIYEPLKGTLSNLHSYHFKKNGVQYRIAYEVIKNDEILFYYMIASRENFYQKLKKRV